MSQIRAWVKSATLIGCVVASHASGQNSEDTTERTAFAFSGFETTVQTIDDHELTRVTPPEPVSPGANPDSRPSGALLDGVLYTTGEDSFWAQFVDPLQGVVPDDWTSLADQGYTFPAHATNFCGIAGDFAWFGLGDARIHVVSAESMTNEIESSLNYPRMIRDFTVDPRGAFEYLATIRAGSILEDKFVESGSERHFRIEFRSDDGEYQLVYEGWFVAGQSLPIRWELRQQKVSQQQTILWQMKIAPYPIDNLHIPSSPGELPSALHRVSNAQSLVFFDRTDSSWPSGWTVDFQNQSAANDATQASANLIRFTFGAVFVTSIIGWYIWRRTQQESSQG